MNIQLLPQILELVSGSAGQEISNKVGLDSSQVTTAATVALPLIIQALTQNTQTETGAVNLANALKKDHDGSLLENVGDYVQKTDFSEGQSILKHLIGQKEESISETVGTIAGIDKAKALQILAVITPIVMSLLGQYMAKQKMSSQELATNLADEQKEVEAQAPDAMSVFKKMIDTNNDGDISGEVINIGSQLLGAFLKK